MVDDGWTDTILEPDDENNPSPSAPGTSGPENWDEDDWDDHLEEREPMAAGKPPGGDPPNNFDFDDKYDEILDNLDYFDAGDEVLESMVHAGYLENDRLDGIARVMDADLRENSLAAINERPDGRYNIFVDQEEFYSIFEEKGVEEAVDVMRHELNHYRDFEDQLLPELRSDGEFSIMLSYFAGNNLQGDTQSKEGATQFITEMESNEQTSELNAYPEEVAAFQQQLQDYGPEVASAIKEQVEENGYSFLFNYEDDRKVYEVEVSDGNYMERGEIDGEEYLFDLDLPEIGELSEHYDFEAEPEGLINKPMNERDLYGSGNPEYDTEDRNTDYSLRQVDDRDVTENVIGGEPVNMPVMADEAYDDAVDEPRV